MTSACGTVSAESRRKYAVVQPFAPVASVGQIRKMIARPASGKQRHAEGALVVIQHHPPNGRRLSALAVSGVAPLQSLDPQDVPPGVRPDPITGKRQQRRRAPEQRGDQARLTQARDSPAARGRDLPRPLRPAPGAAPPRRNPSAAAVSAGAHTSRKQMSRRCVPASCRANGSSSRALSSW